MATAKKTGPKRLSRDDVLAKAERTVEWFHVEELGGEIPLAALTAWEQHRWQKAMMRFEYTEDGKFRGEQTEEASDVLLFSMGVRDDGGPWFTYEEAKNLPAGAVKKAANRIQALSGMDTSVEQAKGN